MGLETVELVMALEEEFEISISDSDAEKTVTPRDMGDLIEAKLKDQGRPMDRSDLDEMLREITLEQTGMPESIYHLDAEYIRDLRVD